jgi:fucose 4-O-acetylase-like acetyltransferase
MPLFFILSGYTSSEVHKWKKLKRNIKKLFINSWLLAAIMILLLVFQQWILYKNINIWHDSLKGIFWGSNFYGKDGVLSMAVLKCMKMAISNCTFSYIFLYTHLKN